MFSKSSRYKKLDDVVFPDPKGREFASKAMRLLPVVEGVLEHVVEDSDRLDHLAYKYYQQPRSWWRICDANPAFMSPRSLIGKEPIKVAKLPVVYVGVSVPWHILKPLLFTHVGVEEVLFGTDDQPLPNEELFDGVILFSIAVGMDAEIENSIYLQELTPVLSTAMSDAGFPVSSNIHIVKTSDNRWELTDQSNNSIFVFRIEGVELNVYQGNIKHDWTIIIKYNEINISESELVDIVDASDFTSETSSEIGRMGKTIAIPMKTNG